MRYGDIVVLPPGPGVTEDHIKRVHRTFQAVIWDIDMMLWQSYWGA